MITTCNLAGRHANLDSQTRRQVVMDEVYRRGLLWSNVAITAKILQPRRVISALVAIATWACSHNQPVCTVHFIYLRSRLRACEFLLVCGLVLIRSTVSLARTLDSLRIGAPGLVTHRIAMKPV